MTVRNIAESKKQRRRTDPVHLRALRRAKEERETQEIASKGPYTYFQCGRHPDGLIIFDGSVQLVPAEMICIHCGQRVAAKVKGSLVDKGHLRRVQSAGTRK